MQGVDIALRDATDYIKTLLAFLALAAVCESSWSQITKKKKKRFR